MEQFFLNLAANPYFAACAGLSVGAGIIILFLSKYGTRIFFPGGTSIEANALARVEKKIDSVDAKTENWMQEHLKCRQWQIDSFVTNKAFEEWKIGRDPLWKRLNRHGHDKDGKVIITEE
jgi:hypothetical protein